MVRCPSCQETLQGETKFCVYCGAKVGQEKSIEPNPQLPAAEFDAQDLRSIIVTAATVLLLLLLMNSIFRKSPEEKAPKIEPTGNPQTNETQLEPTKPSPYSATESQAGGSTLSDSGVNRESTESEPGGDTSAGLVDQGSWFVIAGSFSNKSNATKEAARARAHGFSNAQVAWSSNYEGLSPNYHIVLADSFHNHSQALALVEQMKKKKFSVRAVEVKSKKRAASRTPSGQLVTLISPDGTQKRISTDEYISFLRGPDEGTVRIPAQGGEIVIEKSRFLVTMTTPDGKVKRATPSAFLEAFERSRAHGQLTACKSSLKNIGTALEMYSTDYRGNFPSSLGKLTPNYLKTLPSCPAAGLDTYSGSYSVGANSYLVRCSGKNHTTLERDFPRYSSLKGLEEN